MLITCSSLFLLLETCKFQSTFNLALAGYFTYKRHFQSYTVVMTHSSGILGVSLVWYLINEPGYSLSTSHWFGWSH